MNRRPSRNTASPAADRSSSGALKVYAGTEAPRDVRDPEEDLSVAGEAVLRLGRRFIRVAWTK